MKRLLLLFAFLLVWISPAFSQVDPMAIDGGFAEKRRDQINQTRAIEKSGRNLAVAIALAGAFVGAGLYFGLRSSRR